LKYIILKSIDSESKNIEEPLVEFFFP
jgi:hypothetical protein